MKTNRPTQQPVFFIVFLALLPLLIQAAAGTGLEQYLYLQEKPQDVWPIDEYKAKPRRDKSPDKPDFLYDPAYPYPRIIEYYAHWCGHCKHFKPKYIEFAQTLLSRTQQLKGRVIIETRAISCVPNKQICIDQQIKGYPTIKIYQAFSTNGTKFNSWELHPLQMIRLFKIEEFEQDLEQDTVLDSQQVRSVLPAGARQKLRIAAPNNDNRQQETHFMGRTRKEIYHDAHLSFDFAMRTGIYTAEGPLPKKPREVLYQFLKLLQKALPSSVSLQPLVGDLIQHFDAVATSDANLTAVVAQHPPPMPRWSKACTQHGTGYTCGLWELFHIITIGTVEWNSWATNDQMLKTPQVAESLRSYIEHFFQCDECRSNFLAEYDNCGYDRCNRLVDHTLKGGNVREWMELPLWLYETHNGVNARLRRERFKIPEENEKTTEIEVLWPPVENCKPCWLSSGRWEEEMVYRYLRLEYW
jgi:thiol-disulfide isomerase/thioredoxin